MALHTQISDDEPGSILNALAKALNAKIQAELNECVLDIPDSFGEGTIRLLSFSAGVSILSVSMKLKSVLKLEYSVGVVHPLKIILVKKGSLNHSFENSKKQTTINAFESVIIASTPDNDHSFLVPRNKEVSFLSIQINRKSFEPKVEDFFNNMHRDLSVIFRDVNGIQEFYYKNFYNQESLQLIDEIFSNKGKDFVDSLFVEGKTYQLMMLQLKQYLVNLKSPNKTNSLASRTRQKLSEAVKIIESDIESYTTVKELSAQLDINEKTLQSAFKQYYNCTVNTYVRNFRAHRSRMLVETTDYSVAEIAYKVGLNSPNHLTKLFKLYYGVSPSEHKRKTKSVNDN